MGAGKQTEVGFSILKQLGQKFKKTFIGPSRLEKRNLKKPESVKPPAWAMNKQQEKNYYKNLPAEQEKVKAANKLNREANRKLVGENTAARSQANWNKGKAVVGLGTAGGVGTYFGTRGGDEPAAVPTAASTRKNAESFQTKKDVKPFVNWRDRSFSAKGERITGSSSKSSSKPSSKRSKGITNRDVRMGRATAMQYSQDRYRRSQEAKSSKGFVNKNLLSKAIGNKFKSEIKTDSFAPRKDVSSFSSKDIGSMEGRTPVTDKKPATPVNKTPPKPKREDATSARGHLVALNRWEKNNAKTNKKASTKKKRTNSARGATRRTY